IVSATGSKFVTVAWPKLGAKTKLSGTVAPLERVTVSACAVAGDAGGAVIVTLNGAQSWLSDALQFTPSNARTSSALPSVPVTNVTSLSCAAVTTSSV